MLEYISCCWPLARIIHEHVLQKFKCRGRQPLAVLLGEHVRFPLGGPEQLEPRHVNQAWPFGPRRCTEDVVDLVQLIDLSSIAGEDGMFGEYLNHHARSRPNINRRTILSFTEEKFRRPIPDGDDTVGVIELMALSKEASKAKISKLQLASAADEDVGCFDISMKYSTAMKIIKPFKKLFREVLFVTVVEFEGRVVEETRKVMREILKDHEAVILLYHDFLETDDVLVPQRLQELDFTNGRHGKSILFAFHANLLKSHRSFCIYVNSLEDFPIRA